MRVIFLFFLQIIQISDLTISFEICASASEVVFFGGSGGEFRRRFVGLGLGFTEGATVVEGRAVAAW